MVEHGFRVLGGGWCTLVTIDAFLLPFRESGTFLVTFLLF